MLTGGCNCQSVRYIIQKPPVMVAQCHCRNCQRQSGSAFSVNLLITSDALEITGPLTDYEDSDTKSGNVVVRQFCSACGSPVISKLAGSQKSLIIKAGTLDHPEQISEPVVAVWTSTRWPWINVQEGQKCFEQNPPSVV